MRQRAALSQQLALVYTLKLLQALGYFCVSVTLPLYASVRHLIARTIEHCVCLTYPANLELAGFM